MMSDVVRDTVCTGWTARLRHLSGRSPRNAMVHQDGLDVPFPHFPEEVDNEGRLCALILRLVLAGEVS